MTTIEITLPDQLAQADFIASGDADLLNFKRFRGTEIVTAAEGVRRLGR